jgi:hypothetical protein
MAEAVAVATRVSYRMLMLEFDGLLLLLLLLWIVAVRALIA